MLVYEQSGWIWRADVDGTNSRRFVRGGSPNISPDGRWLLFRREHGAGKSSLHLIPSLGGKVTPVHSNSLAASWSPDSSRILIQDSDGLHIARRNGSGSRLLARQVTEEGGIYAGSAASNGSTVVFTRATPERSDVFAVPISGGEAVELTSDRQSGMSTLGTDHIAFVRYATPGTELWVMRADGSEARLLAVGQRTIFPAIWFGDSRRLVAVTTRLQWFSAPLEGRISVIDIRTGKHRAVTGFSAGLLPLGVSRDGKTILVTRGCGGGGLVAPRDIGTIEALPLDGRKPKVLLRGPCSARWSA